MRIRILGSAAGGGVPQWNCRCRNCEAARAESGDVRPRTQSSIAVSADGQSWFLLNVSPDIHRQILAFPPLRPPPGRDRGQSIAGCVLTDAELDHTAGLLLLREGTSFSIYSTPLVRRWLNRHLPIEPLLAKFAGPRWIELSLDDPCHLRDGLIVRAFEVEPHVPRFVDEASECRGSVVGLSILDPATGGKLVYAPCVGALAEPLLAMAAEADAVLLDGTFWSNDEPLQFGGRTALEMGHVPVSGPDGSLAWLTELPTKRRVYVHINNTNPMLNERGPEYRLVTSRGVSVGQDGNTFEL